jgi:rhodanese-related sulfurtransferase
VGSVGRTDLLGPDATAELTAAQFRTLRRLASLPDDVRILPTHGSGSFCAAGPVVSERVTTLGAERARNPLLVASDEAAFTSALLAGLGEFPAYYAHIAPINRAGPPLVGPIGVPTALPAEAVARHQASGAWVVDARDRLPFAAGHIPGSVNIELNESFGSYVGWIVPFDAPIVLVVPEPAVEAGREAATQLSRIGYDHVLGALDGGLDAWVASGRSTSSYPTLSADDVAEAQQDGESPAILDVRQPIEWRDEGTVPGARQIFVGDLPLRIAELPRDDEITVLCKSGQRAAIAASLLDRAGIPTRLVAEGGSPTWRRRTRERMPAR